MWQFCIYFVCPSSSLFWGDMEKLIYNNTKQFITINLKDVSKFEYNDKSICFIINLWILKNFTSISFLTLISSTSPVMSNKKSDRTLLHFKIIFSHPKMFQIFIEGKKRCCFVVFWPHDGGVALWLNNSLGQSRSSMWTWILTSVDTSWDPTLVVWHLSLSSLSFPSLSPLRVNF